MEFESAKKIVEGKSGSLSQSQLLMFYGLFKQATVGDCNTGRPGMLSFKAKSKWDAWNSNTGMSKEDAAKKYCEEAEKL